MPLPADSASQRTEFPALDGCPFCGMVPFIEDWNGAHYTCVHCKSVTTACCGGASDGESG